MNDHDKIVSALTQWDIRQSKKKGHNKYFLGIQSLQFHIKMGMAIIDTITQDYA